jgi:hypothetical protein
LIFLSGHLGAYKMEHSVGIEEEVRISEVEGALPPKMTLFYKVPLRVTSLNGAYFQLRLFFLCH